MPEERRIDVKPVVASLKDRLETIRRSEMKRLRRQIGRLSPEEEVAIESLNDALVNNIIHAPIRTLEKVACDADASAVIEIVMRLFDLASLESPKRKSSCQHSLRQVPEKQGRRT